MNFLEAVEAIKEGEGEGVKRKGWNTSRLIRDEKDHIMVKLFNEQTMIPSIIDIEAIDWEIYEEKPKEPVDWTDVDTIKLWKDRVHVFFNVAIDPVDFVKITKELFIKLAENRALSLTSDKFTEIDGIKVKVDEALQVIMGIDIIEEKGITKGTICLAHTREDGCIVIDGIINNIAIEDKKTLSDKIFKEGIANREDYEPALKVKDVKESLKEFIEELTYPSSRAHPKIIQQKAKEIFGEELI